MVAEIQPSAVPTSQRPATEFCFETLAGDGSDRSQLRNGRGRGNKRVDVFSDGFRNRVGAGFGQVVYQGSGIVGEEVELEDREVSFREGPSLVEEDGRGVLGVLNRLDGLVRAGYGVKVN